MTQAHSEAEALALLGVPFVAGVPGGGASYELLDACERVGIPFLSTAHEGAGVIIAGAAARQTGGIGAALSIKGPGVANLIGGIALARFENYPVLTFSEAYGVAASAALQHKRFPQDELLAALVKQVSYRGATSIAALAEVALAEPCGPVHRNLVAGPPVSPAVIRRPGPHDDDALGRITDRIRQARRPIVICGSALTRPGLTRVAQPALSSMRIPVFTSAAAKGVIDEREPGSAAVFTAAGGERTPEYALMPRADLVIGLGLRNGEVLGARPFPAPYVSIDALDTSAQEGFEPEHHARMPAGEALAPVLDALSGAEWGLDEVERARRTLTAHFESTLLLPPVCYAVLATVPRARLVTDSGNFTIVAEHVWQALSPQAFVGSSNGRFMGAGLPQAVGAALVSRGAPIVLTIGDGGLPPFVAEIRIAVERRLPLLIVLMTDGHYGSMRLRVEAQGFTPSGIRVPRSSWCAVMEAMGCPAERVTTRDQFAAAVSHWNPVMGPSFIEAIMPDRPYAELMRGVRE